MSYNKTIWHTGDIVHEGELNNMEEGIYQANKKLESVEEGALANKIEGIQLNGVNLPPNSETKKVNILAAPYNLAVPVGTSEDIGKILEKQENGFGWTNKSQDGITPHINSTTKHWMIGNTDTNVDAEGKSAYQVYVASLPQEETPLTESQWLASLKGDKGDTGHNPNLGTFLSTDTLPTGQAGDYITVIVDDGGTEKAIKKVWDGSAWSTTTIEANDATFATGEDVISTPIDDTKLANPSDGALPLAEDVLPLSMKLDGITFAETKSDVNTDGASQNVYDGYIAVQGTNVDKYVYNGSLKTVFTPILNGTKSVRFLGRHTNDSTVITGYVFLNTTDVSNIVVNTGSKDISSYIVAKYLWENTGDTNNAEIVVDVPEGAVCFCGVYGTASLTQENYYCYLQSGDTVKEYVDGKSEEIIGRDYINVGNNIGTIYGDSYIQFYRPTTDIEENAVYKQRSDGYSKVYTCTSHRGQKIRVLSNGGYYMYYAFVKKGLADTADYDNSATLGKLVNGGYLSDVHYNSDNDTWKSLFTISTIGQNVDIDIPNDAVYIYFVWRFTDESLGNRLPVEVRFVDLVHENGILDDKVDELQAEIDDLKTNSAENDSSMYPRITFTIGEPSLTIGEKFSYSDNPIKAFSSPIPLSSGFYINFNSDYRMSRVITYDNNGKLVSNKEAYTYTYSQSENFANSSINWSQGKIVPQYNVRIVVMKKGDAVFTDDDLSKIVSLFISFNDTRINLLKNTNYNNFKERLYQISNLSWTPLKDVPSWGSSTLWFKAGENILGVPYSEAAEYTHYYGQHINARTFLTALKNPWSVMYTECISTDRSATKYGYSYHGLSGLSGPFYGTVCTGLTSYVANYPTIVTSDNWGGSEVTMIAKGNHSHPNGWRTPNGNDSWSPELALEGNEIIGMLGEMDFVWNTGHCSIISDIVTDKDTEEVLSIVWAEQTTPRTRIRGYSPDTFTNRLRTIANTLVSSSVPGVYKEWKIYRMTPATLAKITKPEDFGGYVQTKWYEYNPKEAVVDEDIMVFKGDYCSIAKDVTEGEQHDNWDNSLNDYKLFLNVKRGTDYNTVEIYDEDDEVMSTPIKELDITDSDTDNALDTALANSLYGDNEEGWVLVNVANQDLSEGKYKARVIGDDKESGFCHFEIVDIDFSISISNNVATCTFSSSQGTPYLIRQERNTGMATRYKVLTQEEISGGSCTITLNIVDYQLNRYIKLFVKGTYGVVVKKIDFVDLM